MSPISVKVLYADQHHRFTLLQQPLSSSPQVPSFAQLCDALVQHLDLSLSSDVLATPEDSPLHVWYLDDDNDEYHLVDDEALRDALHTSPDLLRLRIVERRGQPPVMEEDPMPSNDMSNPGGPIDRANMATLLRIYHHLHSSASAIVTETLDNLTDTLQAHPEDATALREARHRLTHLFSSLLHHLHTLPQDYRISRNLLNQLINRFDKIGDEAGLSDAALDASHILIRSVAACRVATAAIRAKYRELVPDDVVVPAVVAALPSQRIHIPRRPLKHYVTHFNRLLVLADESVRKEHARLLRYLGRLVRRGEELPVWNVSLCRAVERTVFHVSRYHVLPSEGGDGLCVEKRAVQALRSSVTRKLSRAGFPEKFITRSGNLVVAMAGDSDVVLAVTDWSKKRLERLAADAPALRAGGGAVLRGGEGGGGGGGCRRRRRDYSAGSGDGVRLSRVTDPSGASRGSSSAGRSRGDGGGSCSRSRSRTRSPSRSRSEQVLDLRGSNSSVKSFGERHGDRRSEGEGEKYYSSRKGTSPHESVVTDGDAPYGSNLDPNPFGAGGGSVHRFEDDVMPAEEGSYESADTSRSQWARVQMELDRERERDWGQQDMGYHSPERRSRQGSPVPPHHGGYERGEALGPMHGHSFEGSADGGSVRSGPVRNGSVHSGSVKISRRLQSARNSVAGGSMRGESVAFDEVDVRDDGSDGGDSVGTDQTVHSESIDGDDGDDDDVYGDRLERRGGLWRGRTRSPSPFPRSGSRQHSGSHRSYDGGSSRGGGLRPDWSRR